MIATAPKLSRRQAEAAGLMVEDAPCEPVLVRAAITGRARMPRASLEITRPDGSVVGNVGLQNTSAAFDPTLRWWLVGDPQPGGLVALVSEGRTQVLLPGGRLRPGPAVEPPWSSLACRMLGWQASPASPASPVAAPQAHAGGRWQEVFEHGRAEPNNPAFLRAVARFRFAAVVAPLLFVLVCFPYLFVIQPLVAAGISGPVLLLLPLLGGGGVALWSAIARQRLVDEAERIEPGASRWGKEIAFTQSYWSGMRKEPAPWIGPLPRAAT